MISDEYLIEVRAGVELDSTPRVVFAALVEPYLLTRWFADEAKVDLRRGGGFAITRGGRTATGRILDLVPARRILISWGPVQASDVVVPGSEVEFFVEPSDAGSRLHSVWWKVPTARTEELEADLRERLERLRQAIGRLPKAPGE